MKKSIVSQQPICKNKEVCEESHYIYKNGFIDHRPARGINEDKRVARVEREIFNFLKIKVFCIFIPGKSFFSIKATRTKCKQVALSA